MFNVHFESIEIELNIQKDQIFMDSVNARAVFGN